MDGGNELTSPYRSFYSTPFTYTEKQVVDTLAAKEAYIEELRTANIHRDPLLIGHIKTGYCASGIFHTARFGFRSHALDPPSFALSLLVRRQRLRKLTLFPDIRPFPIKYVDWYRDKDGQES